MESVMINYMAVIVATLAAYAVGAIWYMPKVFGNAWMGLLGKTPDELGSPAKAMTISFLMTLLTTLCMAYLFGLTGVDTLNEGLVVSFIAALGLYFANIYGDSEFHDIPFKLVAITGGHRVVAMVVMGGVLSVW
jgi:hypothetical protein